MKSILIAIRPQWVEKIVNKEKTIEVRKTRPKIETPFKCYIYMTQGAFKDLGSYSEWIYKNRMKVIGEFVCDKVFLLHPYIYDGGSADLEHHKLIQTFEKSSKHNEILLGTCLSQDEMFDYIGVGNYGYGWHISGLKIYDKPKDLGEFCYPCPDKNYDTCYGCKYFYHDETEMCCKKEAVRPPRSRCYVEGI